MTNDAASHGTADTSSHRYIGPWTLKSVSVLREVYRTKVMPNAWKFDPAYPRVCWLTLMQPRIPKRRRRWEMAEAQRRA